MKYQITCNHCGTRFLVDGKGGQTIECTCPGCEGKMRVTLPKTKKDADSDSSDANDSYQQGYVPAGNGDGNYGNDDGDNGDLCAVTSKEKGNGPDGIKGTYDDGLPATYDQFFDLCAYIRAQDIYSVHWTGQYYTMHLSELYRSLAANVDGPENTMLSSTYDGTVTNAIKLNDAGSPAKITYEEGRTVHAASITTEQVKVEDKQGSREGAYRTLGNYYGGGFN